MGHLVGGPQTNITGIVFRGGGVVSCSDTFSKVIEDSAIGQNTYDFLLVLYSNVDRGRIYYCFCATVDFMSK